MNSDENVSELEIRLKYLKPPSIEQIFGFIKELGVHGTQFERYYSMPYGILKQVRGGYRSLPVKFWPVIYERIVPEYGIKYQKNIHQNKTVTKKVTHQIYKDLRSHDRVINIK